MNRRFFKELILIAFASLLYAVSVHFFIYPADIFLGGVGGISVILNTFLPLSSGMINTVINTILIVLAFIILGKNAALKNLIGSSFTTLFIAIIDIMPIKKSLLGNMYISVIAGGILIAIASAILFFCDSSSGGTDIVALIIKKYSSMDIGNALLATDIIVVIVGGFVLGFDNAIASCLGLIIKTQGINLIFYIANKRIIKRIRKR